MKKILTVLILFVFFSMLVACAPVQSAVSQTLAPLPEDATNLIFLAVTAGIAFLLAKINMGQYTQPIAAVIAPIVVTVIQGWLGLIPPVFDNLVLSILNLIVLFVGGSVGSLVLAKRIKSPKNLLSE